MARSREFDEDFVLDRARDLFWEKGYHATSIQDLEAYLGLSRSNLYRFFGGKRELYDLTLARYRDANLAFLHRELDTEGPLRPRLIELFSATARQQFPECSTGARGCYMVNATTEMANTCSRASSFVARNRKIFVRSMAGVFARARARGEIQPTADPTELANFLFLAYNGLQVVVQTGIIRPTLVKTVKRSIDALPWVTAVD